MRVGMVGITVMFWPLAIARGLKKRRGVRLLAAATLGAGRKAVREHLGMTAEQYAEEFALTLYRDAEEMIEAERLDTVVLNVRHSEHAEWAERLAELGVEVYIPKPFATTVADAERIVRAGSKYGVNIACGPSDRYQPAIMAAAGAMDRGLIGEPFAVRIAHHHGTIEAFHRNDWYRDPKEGGPELSLGWYVIDMALHLTGSDVVTVYADYDNFTSPGSSFMDCGKMSMRMRNGAMVSCDMYFCNRCPFPVWQLEIIGTEGVLSVHPECKCPGRLAATLYSAKGERRLRLPRRAPDRETAWVEGFKKGVPAVVPAETALEITRVSIAARESSGKARPVAIRGRGRAWTLFNGVTVQSAGAAADTDV